MSKIAKEERVERLEVWIGIERLGSRSTLIVGRGPEGDSVKRMRVRPGLGVEVEYTAKRGAEAKVIVPWNNIRLAALASPDDSEPPEESA